MTDHVQHAGPGASSTLATRRASIEEGLKSPVGAMFVPLRGGQRQVPVIKVGQSQLLYRAANGRIVAELEELGVTFGEDPHGDRAQGLFHELLLEKAAAATGPVLTELGRHGQQTEPLLITRDGVLVNGNRRLAAMRFLLDQDRARYGAFDLVSAGVLPEDVSEQDVEFIEASLQMAPDVKLDYGWVNRRMKLRHQRVDLGIAPEAIADAYRIETAQIDREIAELELAHTYLDDFKHTPGAYSTLGDTETLFANLRTQLDDLAPEHRRAWRTAGFVMIDGRAAIKGPMDRLFPFAAPAPASLPLWTLRRWGEEEGIVAPINGRPASNRPSALSANESALVEESLRASDCATTAQALTALMDQLRAEHAEDRAPHQAIKLVGRARSALAGVAPGRLKAKQLRELQAEITALAANVNALAGGAATTIDAPKLSALETLMRKLRRVR